MIRWYTTPGHEQGCRCFWCAYNSVTRHAEEGREDDRAT